MVRLRWRVCVCDDDDEGRLLNYWLCLCLWWTMLTVAFFGVVVVDDDVDGVDS